MLNPRFQCSHDILRAMGFVAVGVFSLGLYHHGGGLTAAFDAGLAALIAIAILINMIGRMLP